MSKIYQRETKFYYEEKQFGARVLAKAYHSRLGRTLLLPFLAAKNYSNWNRKKMQKASSLKKVQKLIDAYSIDMQEYEGQNFANFQEFFLRELPPDKRPLAPWPALVSPADAKVLVYEADKKQKFSIKSLEYDLAALLQDASLAKAFGESYILVYRLAVSDNHHFMHVADGKTIRRKAIDGKLHTVSHFSSAFKIFCENKRVYSLEEWEGLGTCISMEVGAMQVGRIHYVDEEEAFSRGTKKGYFDLGGSTIVQILPKSWLRLDEDILNESSRGVECAVKRGEKVGVLQTVFLDISPKH